MCSCCKIASEASSIWRTSKNVLALERLVQSTLLHAFCGRVWGRILLLAVPKLVTLILQGCVEMSGLSCTAPCGFPSSAGICQQSLSPTVGILFTDTILAKTSFVLEQKNTCSPVLALYNFAFFLMHITSAVL